MTDARLIIVGAGGHAKVVIEAIRAQGEFDIIGALDAGSPAASILGIPILGGDDLLGELQRDGVLFAAVAIGSNQLRDRIGGELMRKGFQLPRIIHPTALISPTARIGQGAVVMARAIIGTSSEVGDLAIVNTGAIADHDNMIGGAAHIAPGVAMAGNVSVGRRSLVGVGSAVRPNILIGEDVTIGAGSAVVTDIPDHCVVGGVPARPLRPREEAADYLATA